MPRAPVSPFAPTGPRGPVGPGGPGGPGMPRAPWSCDFFSRFAILGPALFDHRSSPRVRGIQYFILAAAHLGPLQRAGKFQAQFPPELMRLEVTHSLELLPALRLVQPEQITDGVRVAVPVGMLEHLDRHGEMQRIPRRPRTARSGSVWDSAVRLAKSGRRVQDQAIWPPR